jgi:hypothetical protein
MTRSGIVYKVLAYAHCPVITLSPIVLAECGYKREKPRPAEANYMAGVIYWRVPSSLAHSVSILLDLEVG